MDFDEYYDGEQLEEEDLEKSEDQKNVHDLLFAEDEMFFDGIKSKKDAVLFLVDINLDIFLANETTNEVPYLIVMKSLESFLRAKIISSPDDRIGLVFYNTESSNIQDFPNQFQVLEIENPSAENILKVQKLYSPANFKKVSGGIMKNSRALSLRDVLWNAGSLFIPYKVKDYYRRIFLFTSNDDPHSNDEAKRTEAIAQAANLAGSDISIELFPLKKKLSSSCPPFDVRRFYASVISMDIDEINDQNIDLSTRIYDLPTRLRSRLTKKRTLTRLTWNLGGSVKVGAKVFCLYGKARLPQAKHIHKETNKKLKRISKSVCATTSKILLPSEIGHYVQLDKNSRIPLSKADLAQIKNLANIGLTLVGFKDSSFLKEYYNYKQSYFLYPDDQSVKGSSVLFDALLKQMVKKDKYAIVKIMPRKGSQLRFGCLIPQCESYSEVDHTQNPPGFHLIFLPYADDIKITQLPIKRTPISIETIKVAQFMVNCLEIQDFDFHNFENPQFNTFYSKLQAVALQQKEPEKVEDLLLPDLERLSLYKEIIQLLGESLQIETENEQDLKKRKAKKVRSPPPLQLFSQKQISQVSKDDSTQLQSNNSTPQKRSTYSDNSSDTTVPIQNAQVKQGLQQKPFMNFAQEKQQIPVKQRVSKAINKDEKMKEKIAATEKSTEQLNQVSEVTDKINFNKDLLQELQENLLNLSIIDPPLDQSSKNGEEFCKMVEEKISNRQNVTDDEILKYAEIMKLS